MSVVWAGWWNADFIAFLSLALGIIGSLLLAGEVNRKMRPGGWVLASAFFLGALWYGWTSGGVALLVWMVGITLSMVVVYLVACKSTFVGETWCWRRCLGLDVRVRWIRKRLPVVRKVVSFPLAVLIKEGKMTKADRRIGLIGLGVAFFAVGLQILPKDVSLPLWLAVAFLVVGALLAIVSYLSR